MVRTARPSPVRTRNTGLTPSSTKARRRGHAEAAVPRVERHDLDPLPAPAAAVQLGGGDQFAGGRVEQLGVPGHALAHRRAGADDVQRGRLQPRQQLVEVDVAGGRAGERGAPLVRPARGRSMATSRRSPMRLGGVGHPAVGELEHLRLGQIEGLGDVVGHVVAHLGDLAGHADEPAQERGVLRRCGRSGRRWRWPAWTPAGRPGGSSHRWRRAGRRAAAPRPR